MNSSWESVIWREWRHCDHPSYARQLYRLVSYRPASWLIVVAFSVLDGIVGMGVSLFLSFVVTTDWQTLQQLMLAGGLIWAARGYIVTRNIDWDDALIRLSILFPTDQPRGWLGLSLLFLLCTSIVFGPLLWLLLISLFWGVSGLILWTARQTSKISPFVNREWFRWWIGRPSVEAVQAAIVEAQAALRQADQENDEFTPPTIDMDIVKNFLHQRSA